MAVLTDLPAEVVTMILKALPPTGYNESENQRHLAQTCRISETFRLESQAILFTEPIISGYSFFGSFVGALDSFGGAKDGMVRKLKIKNGSYISYAEPERQVELENLLMRMTGLVELVYEDCRILASSLFSPYISKLVLSRTRVHAAENPLSPLSNLASLQVIGGLLTDFNGLFTPQNLPALRTLYLEHRTPAPIAFEPLFPQILNLCSGNLIDLAVVSIFPTLAPKFHAIERLEICLPSNLPTLQFIEALPKSLAHLRFKSTFSLQNITTLFETEDQVALAGLKTLWIPVENEEKEGMAELRQLLEGKQMEIEFLGGEIEFEEWLRLVEKKDLSRIADY